MTDSIVSSHSISQRIGLNEEKSSNDSQEHVIYDDVIYGETNTSNVTFNHHFQTPDTFPALSERHDVNQGDSAIGIYTDDLSIAYETTATIDMVSSGAGYNNSLGAYTILADGTISSVEMAFNNVKTPLQSDGKINSIEKNIEHIENKINHIEKNIENFENKIEVFEAKQAEYAQKIVDIQAKIAESTGSTKKYEKQIRSFEKKVDHNNKDIDRYEENINKYDQKIQDYQSKVDELQDEIATLQSQQAFTYDVSGEEGSELGFFIIANGDNLNKHFKNIDLSKGELKFVYHQGENDERLAKITDNAEDITFVHVNGDKVSILKGNVFHSTEDGSTTTINPDNAVHIVSGLADEGNTDTLRIGFEDLKNLGDADFNDVVFDVTIAEKTIEVIEEDDVLNGGLGNDIIYGGEGDDSIRGENGDDLLYGENGNDFLDGHIGNDELYGGAGDDEAHGGWHNDLIYGGTGADLLFGGTGNDTIFGGDDDDLIFGGGDDDILNGGLGNDDIAGEEGNDTLNGGDGIDILNGGIGDDILNGDAGSDVLKGGDGTDTLNGGEGLDILYGGGDNDFLNGNDGNDILKGGDGDDILNGGDGLDIIEGGNGVDIVSYINDTAGVVVDLTANTAIDGYGNTDILSLIENAIGSNFDDVLSGNVGINVLHGGDGSDNLRGLSGDDILYGDDGQDILYGGLDNDTLHGGNDDDRLFGGIGNDVLYGDAGSDVIIGEDGDDTLYGGAGRDYLWGGIGADTFSYSGTDDIDTFDYIQDFNAADGDAIDISSVLTGYDAATSSIEDFVMITEAGNSTFLRVNADGTGNDYVLVARINGALGLGTEQDMIDNGALIV